MKKLLEAGLDWDWSDDDGCAHALFHALGICSGSCSLDDGDVYRVCRYTAFLAACEGGSQKVAVSPALAARLRMLPRALTLF